MIDHIKHGRRFAINAIKNVVSLKYFYSSFKTHIIIFITELVMCCYKVFLLEGYKMFTNNGTSSLNRSR